MHKATLWASAFLAVTLLPYVASCQTDEPETSTTQPAGNGWALTNDEMRRRMDEMNSRAPSRPADAPALTPDQLRLWRAKEAEVRAKQAAAVAKRREMGGTVAELDGQLADVRADGTQAEQELAQLQAGYSRDMAELSGPNQQTVQGSGTVTGPFGTSYVQYTATVSGDGAVQSAAMVAARARYDDRSKPVRQKIANLAKLQQDILAKRQQLVTEQRRPVLRVPVATTPEAGQQAAP